MRVPSPRMNSVRFIIVAVVLMLLADQFLFGGKRSYIEEAKRNYYAEQAQKAAQDVKEPPPPIRIEPADGSAYFEAHLPTIEKMEEKAASIPPAEKEDEEAPPPIAEEIPAALPPVVEPGPFKGSAKIAIIIDDLGMDLRHSRQVLDLPAPITLAFLPYGTKTREYAKIGKEKGHALIIHVPMEANDGKLNIGPGGLKANMDQATFDKSFDTILESFDGYEGINNHMGSRLTQDSPAMTRLMGLLKAHDLFFVDSKTINSSVAAKAARAAGVPYAERDVFLDHVESRAFVDGALAKAEQLALRKGSAIAIGHPKENTIAGLKAWIPTLKAKGIELVPVKRLLIKPAAVSSRPEPSGEVEGSQSSEPKPDPSTSLGMTNKEESMDAAPLPSAPVPAPVPLQTELPAIY